MRCKKCAKVIRTPPERMRETQICAECSKVNFPTRDEVKIGSSVMIEMERHSGTGILIEGIVQNILTSGNYHPNGLMVDLQNGERGRVKKLLTKETIKETKESRYITTTKHLESETNEDKKNGETNQTPKKIENVEERFRESQKLMEEILSGKKELQDIFLKLKEKIKHMDPNTIRKLSRRL